jgi:hypothetical protein
MARSANYCGETADLDIPANTPGPQPVLGNLVGYEAATIPTSIKSQRNSISMGLLIRMGGRTAESSHPCVNYIMMIIAERTSKTPTPTITMKRNNLPICP